jgi:hypothetical protein
MYVGGSFLPEIMRRPTLLRRTTAVTLLSVAACSPSTSRSTNADAVSDSGSPARATSPATTAAGPEPVLVVYKTPSCGCCKGWVQHMKDAGFTVEVNDLPDLSAVKREAKVPDELQACHTARIGGYVVEGHVPAADIRRLLAEHPAVTGIGTPGMPMGSPGMEGAYTDRYDVLTFGGSGKSTVFASH